MFYKSDPTANAAIGNLDRELRALRKEAEKLKVLSQNGQLTPKQKDIAKQRFSGIYRHLFNDELY